MKRTFSKGGIHVPENKYTPADRIIDVDLPRSVVITLKQHIGIAATPLVKKGDHVTRGQKIGEAQGRVSAPVHASISGTVDKIAPAYNTTGYTEDAIYIKADDADHEADVAARQAEVETYDWRRMTPEVIVGTIADAGIVGLGGATFPTAMKLTPPPGSKAKYLIINAAECEPYLTCDDALMRAHPREIIEGIEILMHGAKVKRAIIGIEDNKPESYAALASALEGKEGITLQLLKTKYPQGGEKQLIKAVLGVEVASGALPISVGAIVQNVATAYAVYRAVALRIPLIEKVVTIAGHGNYLVPIGMIISEMPVYVDNPPAEADVIIGGPMMGKSAALLDAPFEKGTSGVTVLAPLPYNPQPCIRCGACIEACPMGLEPYLISTYGRLRRVDDAVGAGALDCIECGSCNYSCPSARPILDYIRLAKTAHRNRPKK